MKKVFLLLPIRLIATVIVLFCNVFFQSCKKEIKSDVLEGEVKPKVSLKNFELPLVTSNPWSRAANPNNPLDAVGYFHNKALNDLFNKQIIPTTIKSKNLRTSVYGTFNWQNIYDGSMDNIGTEFGSSIQLELEEQIPYFDAIDYEGSGEHIIDLAATINTTMDSLPSTTTVDAKTMHC